MLPFGVTFPATVPQRSEIPGGLMNYPVYIGIILYLQLSKCFINICPTIFHPQNVVTHFAMFAKRSAVSMVFQESMKGRSAARDVKVSSFIHLSSWCQCHYTHDNCLLKEFQLIMSLKLHSTHFTVTPHNDTCAPNILLTERPGPVLSTSFHMQVVPSSNLVRIS
jgi:hypothetical protein